MADGYHDQLAATLEARVENGEIAIDGDDVVTGSLTVPGEFIAAIERRDDLVGLGVDEVGRADEIGLALFRGAPSANVPAVIEEGLAGGAPHYVFRGEPIYHGGPFDRPEPADEPFVVDTSAPASDATVAVLDTGLVPGEHPWLETRCAGGWEEEASVDADNDGWLDLEAGHGTFVAGLILERAPRATVAVARVLDSDGLGREWDIVEALIANWRADVLNLSLAGFTKAEERPSALWAALAQARLQGCVVVAAAGNAGVDRAPWPAADPDVIAVGALAGEDRASFSNYGCWVDVWAQGEAAHGPFVTFIERGSEREGWEPNAYSGAARWSGTSFAAPRVAGAIAARLIEQGGEVAAVAADVIAGLRRTDVGAVLD